MKIELDFPATGRNIIQSYSAAGIVINNVAYTGSLILSPDQIMEHWSPRNAAELTDAHIQPILELQPELVILGTGNRLQFPSPHIAALLHVARIGFEVMDTPAACRAYNFTAGEGRIVVAALMAIVP